jgi:hypothetical protein
MGGLAPIVASGDIDWVEEGEINMVVARESELYCRFQVHKSTTTKSTHTAQIAQHLESWESWKTGLTPTPPAASSQVPCPLIQA